MILILGFFVIILTQNMGLTLNFIAIIIIVVIIINLDGNSPNNPVGKIELYFKNLIMPTIPTIIILITVIIGFDFAIISNCWDF